ncbi:MAG: hypothetical protein DRP56_03155 [Planctomycetota bacterium]|nr:MAG: hypothetical protein DRP56_03155 [Planctomycetota bacterium]
MAKLVKNLRQDRPRSCTQKRPVKKIRPDGKPPGLWNIKKAQQERFMLIVAILRLYAGKSLHNKEHNFTRGNYHPKGC